LAGVLAVMFAIVLLLVSIGARFEAPAARVGQVTFGAAVLLGAAAVMASFPVQ
jgi:hypothetical protein